MLFLGLLIYLALLPLAYWFGLPLIPAVRVPPTYIWIAGLYVFSALLGALWVFLIAVYNPRAKESMRNLLRIPGVRWFCALTAIVILVCILLEFFWFRRVPTELFMGFLVPALSVSCLNALGIEIRFGSLKEEGAE